MIFGIGYRSEDPTEKEVQKIYVSALKLLVESSRLAYARGK